MITGAGVVGEVTADYVEDAWCTIIITATNERMLYMYVD